MDRKYIDDHHIVARYLADQLSDTEREAFETYYVEHPEMLREMEAVARFKLALVTLRDQGELPELIESPPKLQPAARTWGLIGLAAAVAAVAIGVGYFLNSPPNRPLMAAKSQVLQLPIGVSVVVERMRGGLSDVEFQLPAAPDTAIALRIFPEIDTEPANYDVVLARESNDGVTDIAKLTGVAAQMTQERALEIFLDRTRIEPGVYQLSVTGAENTTAQGQRSIFRIRVRPPA